MPTKAEEKPQKRVTNTAMEVGLNIFHIDLYCNFEAVLTAVVDTSVISSSCLLIETARYRYQNELFKVENLSNCYCLDYYFSALGINFIANWSFIEKVKVSRMKVNFKWPAN
jgi:hypothetical protein